MNKKTILVVEDDAAVRNLITTTLDIHGFRYDVAQTGAAAMLAVVSNKPDIIILDLGLPDMDGVEIIKKVRGWSAVPIIVVSARAEKTGIKFWRWIPARTTTLQSLSAWMNCLRESGLPFGGSSRPHLGTQGKTLCL